MTASTTFLQPLAKAIARRGIDYATLTLTAFTSVLLLMMMGSIVRITGNGLGCPDWPLCYGQVVPPMYASAWVEFSHRFLGALASVQIAGLAVWAWRSYRREKWIVAGATAAVGMLAVQIVVGGLHVIFELPPQTGWIHTGIAMLIAALVAAQVTTKRAALSFAANRNCVI